MVWIFRLVVTGLLVLAVYYIKEIPKMTRDKLLEERKFQNSKDLQIESYFRQIGGSALQDVFDEWTSMLVDNSAMNKYIDEKSGADRLNNLIQRTIMYGSTKTINLLANYQQFNYAGDGKNDKAMFYIASIISSLKYDFTGNEVLPMKLLEVKITDLHDKYEYYQSILNEINSELESGE